MLRVLSVQRHFLGVLGSPEAELCGGCWGPGPQEGLLMAGSPDLWAVRRLRLGHGERLGPGGGAPRPGTRNTSPALALRGLCIWKDL